MYYHIEVPHGVLYPEAHNKLLALKGLGGSRDRKEQDGPTRTLSVCIWSTVLIDKPL